MFRFVFGEDRWALRKGTDQRGKAGSREASAGPWFSRDVKGVAVRMVRRWVRGMSRWPTQQVSLTGRGR